MDLSGNNFKAVLITVIGIAVIAAVRFVLELVYDRYERRAVSVRSGVRYR